MIIYDYIIVGAGASGLMLADALGKDDFFANKKILLLDKDNKKNNDRTWCFWEKGDGDFEELLYKTWDYIYFGGKDYKKTMPIAPYRYKMIRGIDFYKNKLNSIDSFSNINFEQATVSSIQEISNTVNVVTSSGSYQAHMVFNSIFDYKMTAGQTKFPVLQQHFIGWFIETEKPTFNSKQAKFMDFTVPQCGNTRFMYVLPFSETKALVEYTLFSEHLLPKKQYEEAIEDYLRETLQCHSYEITDTEQGSVPMTSYNFKDHNSSRILHIGTAGGWSKPSTGYTFWNTFKKTKSLVQFLKHGKSLKRFNKRNRFWYYDLIFLDVLHRDNGSGKQIFESLFIKRSPQQILKFLAEETTFWEELMVMSAAPTKTFAKALIRRLF
ncbi:MAG: lycopene cyclase family protein [Bacteroidota bacterium]